MNGPPGPTGAPGVRGPRGSGGCPRCHSANLEWFGYKTHHDEATGSEPEEYRGHDVRFERCDDCGWSELSVHVDEKPIQLWPFDVPPNYSGPVDGNVVVDCYHQDGRRHGTLEDDGRSGYSGASINLKE